jgi:hypothetical protein
MRHLRWLLAAGAALVLLVAAGAPTALSDPPANDPSGIVQDLNGDPVAGAAVTLFRSDTGVPGTFVQVPNGSPIITPANNPETTDAFGQFGWSVTPGFYEVTAQASAPNCTDTETTQPIQAPPDNMNLLIVLQCIQTPQHGISFTKGCTSPTKIGDPYSCSYSARNNVDDAQDTLTINGLDDVVHAAAGNVDQGNVFSSLRLDDGGTAATCSGPGISGAGTSNDPWTNATSCTIPFGSRINVQSFSHYTVQPGDFTLPGNALKDDATLTWQDECNGTAANPQPGGGNCVPSPPTVGAGSQSVIVKRASATATSIHDAGHNPVTIVDRASIVHDFVSVTTPDPSPAQGDPDRERHDRLLHQQPVPRLAARDVPPDRAGRERNGRRDELPAGTAVPGVLRVPCALPG